MSLQQKEKGNLPLSLGPKAAGLPLPSLKATHHTWALARSAQQRRPRPSRQLSLQLGPAPSPLFPLCHVGPACQAHPLPPVTAPHPPSTSTTDRAPSPPPRTSHPRGPSRVHPASVHPDAIALRSATPSPARADPVRHERPAIELHRSSPPLLGPIK